MLKNVGVADHSRYHDSLCMVECPDTSGCFTIESGQVPDSERGAVQRCLEDRLKGESERFRTWAQHVLFRLRPHEASLRVDGGRSGLRYIIEEHRGEATAAGPACFDGVFFEQEKGWHIRPLPQGVGLDGEA